MNGLLAVSNIMYIEKFKNVIDNRLLDNCGYPQDRKKNESTKNER